MFVCVLCHCSCCYFVHVLSLVLALAVYPCYLMSEKVVMSVFLPALSTVIAASVSAQNQREILGTNNQSGVTETTVEGGQSAAIDLLSSLQQKTAAQSQFKRMYIIGERQHLKVVCVSIVDVC